MLEWGVIPHHITLIINLTLQYNPMRQKRLYDLKLLIHLCAEVGGLRPLPLINPSWFNYKGLGGRVAFHTFDQNLLSYVPPHYPAAMSAAGHIYIVERSISFNCPLFEVF